MGNCVAKSKQRNVKVNFNITLVVSGFLLPYGSHVTSYMTSSVFNVSKQSENLKTSVDVQIRTVFNAAVPAGTQAYAVVISDKRLPVRRQQGGCGILKLKIWWKEFFLFTL